jgi:membrane associated rhomboid family serine protease
MFILPFNKDDRPVSAGWALCSLILLNTSVQLWSALHHSTEAFATAYGFVPAHPHWSTAFAAMFLHAGWWHLIGNLWFLWMFGRHVETEFGGGIFLCLYLICGLGGQGLHYAFNSSSGIPLVGASGAISGIAGLYYVLFPFSRFDLDIYLGWWHIKTIETRTRGAVGAWIGEQTVLGVITSISHVSSIAFWAHVGGFSAGALLALVTRPWLDQKEDLLSYR